MVILVLFVLSITNIIRNTTISINERVTNINISITIVT